MELPRLPVAVEGRRKAHRPSAGRDALPAGLPQPPWKTARLRRVAAGFPQALGKPPALGGSRIGFPHSHSPDGYERLTALSQPTGESLRTRHGRESIPSTVTEPESLSGHLALGSRSLISWRRR